MPADTRIEFHRSLYHFFEKNRGPGYAFGIKALRILKTALYVVTRAPLALFGGKNRDRWQQDWIVLRWHMRGRPDNEGLRRTRPTADSADDKEGKAS